MCVMIVLTFIQIQNTMKRTCEAVSSCRTSCFSCLQNLLNLLLTIWLPGLFPALQTVRSFQSCINRQAGEKKMKIFVLN